MSSVLYTARPGGLASTTPSASSNHRTTMRIADELRRLDVGQLARLRAVQSSTVVARLGSPAVAGQALESAWMGSGAFPQAPHVRSATPNPSVNRSANGRPPTPGRWYAVHFHRPGAGGLPSSPGYLER
jgi:hypothetical protein